MSSSSEPDANKSNNKNPSLDYQKFDDDNNSNKNLLDKNKNNTTDKKKINLDDDEDNNVEMASPVSIEASASVTHTRKRKNTVVRFKDEDEEHNGGNNNNNDQNNDDSVSAVPSLPPSGLSTNDNSMLLNDSLNKTNPELASSMRMNNSTIIMNSNNNLNSSHQERKDEHEFSKTRCSGVYLISSMWCSLFYVTLLFSCLFMRQTIHVGILIAAVAKPCVRRIRGKGLTNTMPQLKVILVSALFSAVLLSALVTVAIMASASEGGLQAARDGAWVLHCFGIWNPIDHPVNCAMSIIVNLLILLLCGVYQRLLGTRDMISEVPEIAKRRRLHERIYLIRVCLGLAVAAFSRPSILAAPFYILHVIVLASFCVKRTVVGKWKVLQTTFLVTSVYSTLYLLIFLAVQNDIFSTVLDNDQVHPMWGLKWRDFETVLKNEFGLAGFIVVHVLAVFDVLHTSRRIHGRFSLLLNEEAESYVHDRILERVAEIRERARRKNVSKNSFAMTLFNALVDAFPILMLPVLVIVVNLIQNVPAFGILLATIFGFVAPTFVFVPALPALYVACSFVIAYAFVSEVVGGQAAEWMALYLKDDKDYNRAINMLSLAVLSFCCTCWIFVFSLKKKQSTQKASAKTMSAMLASKRQKLERALDVVEDRLHPLAVQFKSLCNPGSQCITREGFPAVIHVVFGVEPSEEETERIWNTIVLQSEENLGALEQQNKIIEQQRELEFLKQQRREHDEMMAKVTNLENNDESSSTNNKNKDAAAASSSFSSPTLSSPRFRGSSMIQNNSSFSAAAVHSFAKAIQFFSQDDDEDDDDIFANANQQQEEQSLSNLLIARSMATASSGSPSNNNNNNNNNNNRARSNSQKHRDDSNNNNDDFDIPTLNIHDENENTVKNGNNDTKKIIISDAAITPSARDDNNGDLMLKTKNNNNNNNNTTNLLNTPNPGNAFSGQSSAAPTPSASSPSNQQARRKRGTSMATSVKSSTSNTSSPSSASQQQQQQRQQQQQQQALTSALATELLQEEETVLMVSHRLRHEAIQKNRNLAATISSPSSGSPRNNNENNNNERGGGAHNTGLSSASFFSGGSPGSSSSRNGSFISSFAGGARRDHSSSMVSNSGANMDGNFKPNALPTSNSAASLHREETSGGYTNNMNNNINQQNHASTSLHTDAWLMKDGNIGTGNTNSNFFATVMAASRARAASMKSNNNNQGAELQDPTTLSAAPLPPSPTLGLRFSGFLELHAEVARYRMWEANFFFVVVALIRDLIARNTESISLLIMFAAASYRSDLDCIRMIFILIFVAFLCFPSIRKDYWWVLIAYNILVILVLYAFSLVYTDVTQPDKIGLVDAGLLGLRKLATPADLYVDFVLLAVAVLQIRTRPGAFRGSSGTVLSAKSRDSVTFRKAEEAMKKDFEHDAHEGKRKSNSDSSSNIANVKTNEENNGGDKEMETNNNNNTKEEEEKQNLPKTNDSSSSSPPLNAPNLPLDTLKQILTDMEWHRLSRTAGTRSAKARLALIITVVCFIAVVVVEDQSALVAFFAITFVWKLRLLNTMPTSYFTFVINLGNTIYSVLALVAVSLFQFPSIRVWFTQLVGSLWLCEKYGSSPQQCTSDVGFASAASKDEPATLTLLPWFVGCTSNIVLFTLSGAENEEKRQQEEVRQKKQKEDEEEEEKQQQQQKEAAANEQQNGNKKNNEEVVPPISIATNSNNNNSISGDKATTKLLNSTSTSKTNNNNDASMTIMTRSSSSSKLKKTTTAAQHQQLKAQEQKEKQKQQQEEAAEHGSISKTIANITINKDSAWISRPVYLLFTILAFFGRTTDASRVWLSHHGAKIVWLSLFIAGIRYRSCLNCVYIILLILDRRGWTCIAIGAIHLLIVYNYPLFFVPSVPLLGKEWERFLGFPKQHKENTLFAPVFVAVCSLIYLQAKKQAQVLKPTLPKEGMVFFANDKAALKREQKKEIENHQRKNLLIEEARERSMEHDYYQDRENNKNENDDKNSNSSHDSEGEKQVFDEDGNLTMLSPRRRKRSVNFQQDDDEEEHNDEEQNNDDEPDAKKPLLSKKSSSFSRRKKKSSSSSPPSSSPFLAPSSPTSNNNNKKATIHDLFSRPSVATFASLSSMSNHSGLSGLGGGSHSENRYQSLDDDQEQEMKSLLHLQEGTAGFVSIDEGDLLQTGYSKFEDDDGNNNNKQISKRFGNNNTSSLSNSQRTEGDDHQNNNNNESDDDTNQSSDDSEAEEREAALAKASTEAETDRKRKLLRMLFPLEGSMMLPRNVLQHIFQLQYSIRRYFFSVVGYEMIILLLLIGIAATTEHITSVFFFVVTVMLWIGGRHSVLTEVDVSFRCHVILCLLLLAFTLLNVGTPPSFYDAPPMRNSPSCDVKWWKYLGCDIPLTDEVFIFMILVLLRLAYLGADARRPLIDRPVEGCRTLGEYFQGKEQELIELRTGARDDAEAVLPPLPHDVLMSPRTLPESLVSLYFGFFPTAILAFFHGALQTSIVSIAEMLLGLCLIVYATDIYWLFYRYWKYVTGFLLGLIAVQLLANLPPVSDWAFETPNVASSIGVAPWTLARVTTFSVVLQIAVIWSSFVQDRIFNEFFFAWKLQALHKGSILCYQRHQQLMVHMSEQAREQELIASAKEAQLVEKLEKIREERFGKKSKSSGSFSKSRFTNGLGNNGNVVNNSGSDDASHNSSNTNNSEDPFEDNNNDQNGNNNNKNVKFQIGASVTPREGLASPIISSNFNDSFAVIPAEYQQNHNNLDGQKQRRNSSSSSTSTSSSGKESQHETTEEKEPTFKDKLNEIRNKVEIKLTELILTAIDMLSEQSYTGRRPALHYHLTTRLVMALYKFAVRRTGDLCVLAFAINFAESGSMADMMLCVSGLIHALVVLPWSSESYWEGCLIYSVFGILVKSAIKICAENIIMSQNSKVAVSVLFLDLGVSSGDPNANVSQAALIDIVFDFFAFGSILLHRRMCVQNGVYVAGEERMKKEEEERQQEEYDQQQQLEELKKKEEYENNNNDQLVIKPRRNSTKDLGVVALVSDLENNDRNNNNSEHEDDQSGTTTSKLSRRRSSQSSKSSKLKTAGDDQQQEDDHDKNNTNKNNKLKSIIKTSIINKKNDSDRDENGDETLIVKKKTKSKNNSNKNNKTSDGDNDNDTDETGKKNKEDDDDENNDDGEEEEDEEEEEEELDGQFVGAARQAAARRGSRQNMDTITGRVSYWLQLLYNDCKKVGRRLQKRLTRFLNELQGNIAKRSGSGQDFYTLYLTVDFLVLIYVTFGYYTLIGTVRGSFLDGLQQNLLPGPLVLTMLGLVISMIIDRIIYVMSHIRAKYLFHVLQAILIHSLYIGWKIWFNSPHIASGVTLYFIKVLYLYVCCAQIRNGFAAHRRHDPFTEYATILYWFGHLIYRAVPFLFELRVLLDWSFARTALRLKAWWLVEDVHFWIYNRFTDIDDDRVTNPKRGSSFPVTVKVLHGLVLFLILIFVLFFPLMYYSTFNPNLVPNKVNSITARFSLAQVSEIYDSTSLGYDASSDLALQRELSRTRPSLNQYSFNDDTRTVQLIELESCSANLWSISPYTRRQLLQRIQRGIAKAESVTEEQLYEITRFSEIFFIDLSMRVIRFGAVSGASTDVTLQRRTAIPVYSLKQLYNIVSRTKRYPDDETTMPEIAREMIRRNPNITQDVPADTSNSVWIPRAFDPFVFNRPTGVELFSSVSGITSNQQGCLLVNYNFSSSSSSSSNNNNIVDLTSGETWCLRCSALFKDNTLDPVNGSSFSCPASSNLPCNFEASPPANSSVPGMYFVSLSEPIPSEGGFLPNIGIIALYTTFILTLFTLLRRKVTQSSHRVTLEEVADPRPVAELVSYIYLTRSVGGENDLVLEELLYFELLDLVRSPESLLNLTGRRVEDYDAETEKYVRSIDVNF